MKDVSVKSGTPGLSLGSAKNVKRLADMSSAMKAKFDPPKQPELSFDHPGDLLACLLHSSVLEKILLVF